MSLAYSFRLTPAQSKLLLQLAFMDRMFADDGIPIVIRDRTHIYGDNYVSILHNLVSKGLAECRTSPKDGRANHIATAHGRSVAEMIVNDAKAIIAISECNGKRCGTPPTSRYFKAATPRAKP